MMWTYRVFRDSQDRYSIREVFTNATIPLSVMLKRLLRLLVHLLKS